MSWPHVQRHDSINPSFNAEAFARGQRQISGRVFILALNVVVDAALASEFSVRLRVNILQAEGDEDFVAIIRTTLFDLKHEIKLSAGAVRQLY